MYGRGGNILDTERIRQLYISGDGHTLFKHRFPVIFGTMRSEIILGELYKNIFAKCMDILNLAGSSRFFDIRVVQKPQFLNNFR
jgi:hypothetical protein